MGRSFVLLLLTLASLPSRAQWNDMGFGQKVLAFGVHDTSLFISDQANSSESLIYRYVPPFGWDQADIGIDRSQGYITSFASLGKYFFAGNNEYKAAYRSSDNGSVWKLNASGPMFSNGTYLFASSSTSAYRSINNGDTWQGVPCPAANSFAANGSIVLASTTKGLYRSTDSGGTWGPVTSPISNIQSFAVVDTVIYATNGRDGQRGTVIRSLDSGANWSLMSTPGFTVTAIVTDGRHLFVGGDSGVYLLDTGGAIWSNVSDSLKGHAVVALGVFDTLLFADFTDVTYPLRSRSIREMTDTTKSAVRQSPKASDTIAIYPNPVTGLVTIFAGGTAIERVSVLNVLGVDVLTTPRPLLEKEGEFSLDLSSLPSGTYFVRIQTAAGSVLRKVIRE